MRIICAGDQHDPGAEVLLASVPLGDTCSAMLRRIAAQIDNTDHEMTGAGASCSKTTRVPMRASD